MSTQIDWMAMFEDLEVRARMEGDPKLAGLAEALKREHARRHPVCGNTAHDSGCTGGTVDCRTKKGGWK